MGWSAGLLQCLAPRPAVTLVSCKLVHTAVAINSSIFGTDPDHDQVAAGRARSWGKKVRGKKIGKISQSDL